MGIRLQLPGVEFSVAKSERKRMATMRQPTMRTVPAMNLQVVKWQWKKTMATARLKSPV